MRSLRPTLALVVTLLLPGCLGSGGANPFGDRPLRQDLIEVTVENVRVEDVEVWAYWQGRSTRVRLGVVPVGDSRTFEIPWYSAGVRFTADQRRDYYPVQPGDHVYVEIGGARSYMPRRIRG